jgi:hypothetical protein
LSAYKDAVRIVDGGRHETVVNPTIAHLKADVLTLDGKPV